MDKGCNKFSRKNSINLRNSEPGQLILETRLSFKNPVQDIRKSEYDNANEEVDGSTYKSVNAVSLPKPVIMFSPRPVGELDAAAIKLQKVYKSYRTRRNLADCAVAIEELWWKTLDFEALKRCSVSFFNNEKPETAVSRWARARTRAARVGKGLSKDEKAQQLATQRWLEAIDPCHRYWHNLHLYYDIWFKSESLQPFFYWLDVGDGKELNLDECSRANLEWQCIKYLGPKERESYEIVVENGKLVYKQSGSTLNTVEGSKWIFVLSTTRILYVGKKKKGLFQHSSFLSGGAITTAGRLVAHDGVLKAIWQCSGHYQPTEESFSELINFLEDHGVDLANRCAIDDDFPPFNKDANKESILRRSLGGRGSEANQFENVSTFDIDGRAQETESTGAEEMDKLVYNLAKHLSCKGTTGAGPSIGCAQEYPADLQFRALEQVNLSPPISNYGPIPSPRQSPKIRLSPTPRAPFQQLPKA